MTTELSAKSSLHKARQWAYDQETGEAKPIEDYLGIWDPLVAEYGSTDNGENPSVGDIKEALKFKIVQRNGQLYLSIPATGSVWKNYQLVANTWLPVVVLRKIAAALSAELTRGKNGWMASATPDWQDLFTKVVAAYDEHISSRCVADPSCGKALLAMYATE